jgi:thiol-disulfide isomerase/thioredoxin
MVHMRFRILHSTSVRAQFQPFLPMVRCLLSTVAILWGSFDTAIAGETVLLDFSSESCGPCQQMRPVVRQLAQAGYPVREIDVSRQQTWADHFGITQVPAFVLVVENREVARLIGSTSYEQLENMFQQVGVHPGREPEANGQSLVPAPPAPAQAPIPIDRSGNLSSDRSGPGQLPRELEQMPGSALPAKTSLAGAGGPSQLAAPLIESAVRITVGDPLGNSTGTGTIVDARKGEALVITCGHIFRASDGKGTITVTLFQAGPGGLEVRTTIAGIMVDYDLERDLGLVRFKVREPVRVAPIAPQGTRLASGSQVTTIGCNHGDNPTAIRSQITTIDRYEGPSNVQVAGAPVEGRSGGGLFNEQGQLVGVCFAADPQANEGLYSAVRSIHAKLDSLQLAKVYRDPSLGNASLDTSGNNSQDPARVSPEALLVETEAESFASTSAAAQVFRGQDPPMPAPPSLFNNVAPMPLASGSQALLSPAPVRTTTASLSATERATLEEIGRLGAESEVIIIIQPRMPNGKSEVITVQHGSPDFVHALLEPVSGASAVMSRPQQTAQLPAAGTNR